MGQSLRTDIRKHVQRCSDERECASTLENWLIEATWNVHRNRDPEVRALAGRVGLYLAVHDQGHRTEPELRRLLQETLAETPVGASGPLHDDLPDTRPG